MKARWNLGQKGWLDQAMHQDELHKSEGVLINIVVLTIHNFRLEFTITD
jgi:hypothetical protein